MQTRDVTIGEFRSIPVLIIACSIEKKSDIRRDFVFLEIAVVFGTTLFTPEIGALTVGAMMRSARFIANSRILLCRDHFHV